MKKIKFHEPFLTGLEEKYLKDVFKQNQFYGLGKYTRKCEAIIGKKLNQKNILLTDSCSSSLEIASLLIKDRNKDEIIVPSYTFSSTANAFLKANFKVIFAEIDKQTLMIDIKDVLRKISPKTKGIVAVHYGGLAANVDELKKICDSKKICLIEDAAQGFECRINNRAVGTIGHIGCFSFHETKNIHAGLGGAIYIKNFNLFKRALAIRERGLNRHEVLSGKSKSYSWVEKGGSYYPSEFQAAFLYPQLLNSKKNTSIRRVLYNRYTKNLNILKKEKKIFFNKIPNLYISNYHAFIIILPNYSICKNLRVYLLSKKIDAYIGYVPLHSSKMGLSLCNKKNKLEITESVSKKVLRLPMNVNLNTKDIDRVCKEIEKFMRDKV